MKTTLLLFIFVVSVYTGHGQSPIEDNSFLLEEAYNQEKGVIQYISTFFRQRNGDFGYSFTNEFPVSGQRHQFSYTLQAIRADGHVGIGDTFINYRYQLRGLREGDKVAIAPRLSLILPTGNYRKCTGTGAPGYQVNLPISIAHSKHVVTHWNAGLTFTPRARNTGGDRANAIFANLGQSTVILVRHNLNIMFENVWNKNANVIAPGRTRSSYSFLVNPGIRWAWNFKNGLQIVPGIAAPIGIGPSYGERGIFLYLSFEK